MDLQVKREYGCLKCAHHRPPDSTASTPYCAFGGCEFTPELPWKVVGIEDDDSTTTILHEAYGSDACVRFLVGYVRSENAGNWRRVAVVDIRSNPVHVLRMWERKEV